jgi:hypothetical protein
MSHVRLRGSHAFRLLVLCFWLSFPSASFADESTTTPAQVVFQWLEWYPKDLPNAAALRNRLVDCRTKSQEESR